MGSLDGSGEEPRVEGVSINDGQGLPDVSWVKRGGGQLQFREGVFSGLIQEGQGERYGASLIMGCDGPGIGGGPLVARVLSSGGGKPFGTCLDLASMTPDGVLG